MEDIYYKGYKIRIKEDESADSPDDWGDDSLFLVYDHRQFKVKRDGFSRSEICESLNFNYWAFPVEAYIHSGVYLSLFNGTKQCRWDSNVSGYILASKSEFELEETARNASEELIETWNQYLCGDVWGFIIEKPETRYILDKVDFDTMINTGTFTSKEFLDRVEIKDEWEEVDSCWGFYGQDAAIDEAILVIDNLTKE